MFYTNYSHFLKHSDTEGLITEAILMGSIEMAVELCMKAKKYTEAIILAKTGW